MTALLPGPLHLTPRLDNSIGFFDRVNGGGLIHLVLNSECPAVFAWVLPRLVRCLSRDLRVPDWLHVTYSSLVGCQNLLEPAVDDVIAFKVADSSENLVI